MNVTGFQDALNDAILVHLSDILDVRFVSLPGMAVLKLIAWRDRHNEFPTKDAVDIATLLKYYSEAGNDERMFEQHADLMETADFDFEMAGARMLGRDMAKIMRPQTKKAVLEILDLYTDLDRNDLLINAITINLPDKNYEKALKYYQNLIKRTKNESLIASLLLPVARIQKKRLNHTDAINTYKLIEQKYSHKRMNRGIPLGVIALMETGRLYLTVGDTLNALKSTNYLISQTVKSHWELGEVQFTAFWLDQEVQ